METWLFVDELQCSFILTFVINIESSRRMDYDITLFVFLFLLLISIKILCYKEFLYRSTSEQFMVPMKLLFFFIFIGWMVYIPSNDLNIMQALVALKKGAHLLKYGRRGKPKFCPFRLSTVGSLIKVCESMLSKMYYNFLQ